MTELHVTFWNLENLFDVADSPRRSPRLQRQLRRELTGWDDAILGRKLSQLALILGQINDGRGPDLLGVCEVENDFVLERLAETLASTGRSYAVAHEQMDDKRGIDLAFLFDPAVMSKGEQFSHRIVKRSATRDLFQVNFTLASGQELIAIANHWPSRLGGQFDSEPYRILAGETLSYFHERIREIKGTDVAILAMGDFNDEPFDRSLVHYALSTAQPAKVLNATGPRFLNMMLPAIGERAGTHYHSNTPGILDQFLVSKGLIKSDSPLAVVPDSVAIEIFPEMMNDGDYPTPIRFGRPSKGLNEDGFSDHYPISIKLIER